MDKSKKICAVMTVMAMLSGGLIVGAVDNVANDSYFNVGGKNTNPGATAGTACVDARAGASILVTPKPAC